MSIFTALKKLFSGKKQESPEEAQAVPVELPEETPITQTEQQKKPSEFRPQIACKHCGAPNDSFVSVCWLCKKEL